MKKLIIQFGFLGAMFLIGFISSQGIENNVVTSDLTPTVVTSPQSNNLTRLLDRLNEIERSVGTGTRTKQLVSR